MMMQPYDQGVGPNIISEALPLWDETGESPDHRQYIFHYHTMMCPQFMNGYCPRHKASRSAPPQCFCYHFESQRRRPLVDTLTGQLRYWDVLCDRVAEGEECPLGDACPYSHTREEISYHAAKYKTKLCNDRDCRGEEVCCFAHGEEELRTAALDRYSYWSVFGAVGAPGPRQAGPAIDLAMGQGYGSSARGGATGALYHPKVYKHRFCASYPNVSGCRRGDACAFAHSREEIRTSLLAEDEELQRPHVLTNEFFMYKFKTLWCPIGVQHDWQTCVYAHNYQDARRHPGIGYGPRPCPYWKRKETTLEYSQRCPLGVRCPFSHGAKEQLYHPAYFKTVTCQDWPNSNCPRGKLCAFWHRRSQQRTRPGSAPDEEFNYKLPIDEGCLTESLQVDFLSPPFKLLNALQADVSGFPELMDGQEHPGEFDMGMGQGMAMPGGLCDPSQPMMGNWMHSDVAALCSYGPPATPTTAADSDEAASADSSLSGGDKSQALQEEDRIAMVQAERCQQGMEMQMLPPVNGDLPWQGGACDPNMWGAAPPWVGDGGMQPPSGMQSPNGMPTNGQMCPGGMGPGGMEPVALPPNMGTFGNCGPMPGCGAQQQQQQPQMPQQQMFFCPVQQPGNMGVQQPGNMGVQQPFFQPATPSLGPQQGGPPSPCPQMLQPLPLGPAGPMADSQWLPLDGCQGLAPEYAEGPRPCVAFEYRGPDSCVNEAAAFFGSCARAPEFMPRPQMTVEELPVEAYRALTYQGRPTLPIGSLPAPAAPAASEEAMPVACEEAMPTCNGFIHFKDSGSDPDVSPTGRPRANSH